MRATPRHRGWQPRLTAAVLLAIAARCLRPDEMHCENAVARLVECCPGFQAGLVSCEYVDGCGITYPAISEEDSRCIVGKSCGALAADGTCAAAQVASPRSTSTSAGASLCR